MRASVTACLTLLLAVSTAGCADEAEGGTGRVSFAVTDAPTDDYSSVNVTFSRAAIHRSGDGGDSNGTADDGDGNATDDDEDEGGAGWITIVNTTRTVDLLALHRNNTAETLGFADIEAGHYQQVRFYVDSVVATKKSDGTQVTMTVPSGVIKTSGSFTVEAGGNTTITVEIDLDQSIKCNNRGCRFTPHIGHVRTSDD